MSFLVLLESLAELRKIIAARLKYRLNTEQCKVSNSRPQWNSLPLSQTRIVKRFLTLLEFSYNNVESLLIQWKFGRTSIPNSLFSLKLKEKREREREREVVEQQVGFFLLRKLLKKNKMATWPFSKSSE